MSKQTKINQEEERTVLCVSLGGNGITLNKEQKNNINIKKTNLPEDRNDRKTGMTGRQELPDDRNYRKTGMTGMPG
jgi:hypothetical protein